MEIYPDIIFLENFLMDYVLLWLTGKILRKIQKPLRILMASALGGGYTVVYYIVLGLADGDRGMELPCFLSLFNFVVMIGMVKITFRVSTGKELLLCAGTCLGIAFVAGGVLTWAEESFGLADHYATYISMLVGCLLFGYLFLQRLFAAMKEKNFHVACNLPVQIKIGEKTISCIGLLDSGNSLYEPITGRPVVIVEDAVLLESGYILPVTGYFAIPYHAIGTEKGILKGVFADELEIRQEQGETKYQRVMLGIYEGKISNADAYQVILHPKL